MKIVHSLWSKPLIQQLLSKKSVGGWPSASFFYMSWALSCLKCRQFYDKVELVTDRKGYSLLIEKLRLPYTDVRVVLDDLNDYHTDLWALGKIYAYSIQEEGFIHVDSDVYIWRKFNANLEQADLIAQHKEDAYNHNDKFWEDVAINFSFIPEEIVQYRKKYRKITEVNAGILGGNDLTFLKRYTQRAFEFVDKNHRYVDQLKHKGMFNTIYEQYLLYCMAFENHQKISYLFNHKISQDFIGMADFSELPNRQSFIHAVGIYKRSFAIAEQLAHRLWYEFPEVYKRIIQLNGQKLI